MNEDNYAVLTRRHDGLYIVTLYNESGVRLAGYQYVYDNLHDARRGAKSVLRFIASNKPTQEFREVVRL